MCTLFSAWKCVYFTSALFIRRTCVHVRRFCLAHLHMSVTLWIGTCRYLIFYYFESLNLWSALWVSCHQGQHLCHRAKPVPNLCHNANNLPLWTWWQPKVTQSHSPPLTSTPWVHAEISTLLSCPSSPWLVGKVCKKMFCKRNMNLQMTFLSPKTDTYIHLPSKWEYTNIDSSTQPRGDTW